MKNLYTPLFTILGLFALTSLNAQNNVGIGTASPTEKLEITGNMKSDRFMDRDDDNYFIDPANNGTAGVFNGNIGIGTTSPAAAIDMRNGHMRANGNGVIRADLFQAGIPPQSNDFNIANGWTNNDLVFGDQKGYTLTASSAPSSGSLNNLFYPDGNVTWNASATPLEIELSGINNYGWHTFMFGSNDNKFVDSITIEGYDGSSWSVVTTDDCSGSNNVCIVRVGYGYDRYRFILDQPRASEIQINFMAGYRQKNNGLGNTGLFLSREGDQPMYGNLNLNGNWLSGDGGNEGVYVQNNGNVGIGTSNPNVSLDVNGSFGASGTITFSSLGSGFVKASGGTLSTSGSVDLSSDVSGTLDISNGGTNNSSFSNNELLIYDGSSISSSGKSLGDLDGDYIQNQTSSDQSASFRIGGNGIVKGNFGVGTSSPSKKFDVQGDATVGKLEVRGNEIRFNEARGIDYDEGANAIYYNDSNNGRVTMLGNIGGNAWFKGNLGVGTTSPSRKLEVDGDITINRSSTTNPSLRIGNADISPERVLHIQSNGDVFAGSIDGNGTSNDLHLRAGGNTQIFAEAGGNVGINTTSPSTKLDVNGQIRMRGGSPADGKVMVSDNNGNASWKYLWGEYDHTCDNWSSKGWKSKMHCLQDGRWHRLVSNNGPYDCSSISQQIYDLRSYYDQGVELLIIFDDRQHPQVKAHVMPEVGNEMYFYDPAGNLDLRLTEQGSYNLCNLPSSSSSNNSYAVFVRY